MVTHEQILEVERFIKAQRKLPFAERVRVRSVKHILTVLSCDDAELTCRPGHEEAWPNLFRFARLMDQLRLNTQRLQKGEAIGPFDGCESRPAMSTQAVEVGNSLLFSLADVLDEQNEAEQAFYAEVGEFCKHLQSLANEYRARRRPARKRSMPTLVSQLDEARDAILRRLR